MAVVVIPGGIVVVRREREGRAIIITEMEEIKNGRKRKKSL